MRLVLLLALAVGCGPALPAGFPLANDGPAVAFVLQELGAPGAARPAVWGVDSDCTTRMGSPGFTDPADGECVNGLHFGGDVWVAVAPGVGYSLILCHEVAHFLWGDGGHRRGDLWGARGADDRCSAALAARADLDGIKAR